MVSSVLLLLKGMRSMSWGFSSLELQMYVVVKVTPLFCRSHDNHPGRAGFPFCRFLQNIFQFKQTMPLMQNYLNFSHAKDYESYTKTRV